MGKVKLTIILVIIIVFCIASYFLITHFDKPENATKYPSPPMVHVSPTTSNPSVTISPTTQQISTGQTSACIANKLTGTIKAQGAAGNIYGSLELTNSGNSPCSVELGNTITATTNAKNVTIHYQQPTSSGTLILKPGEKAYSQVHYPNGPQCQSGISPQPITFAYKTAAATIPFHSTTPGTLQIQACTSPSELTTIDIWPLSKTPITQ